MPKSAIEKRDHHRPPEIEVLRESKGENYPPGKMLIASPLAVEAIVRQIRKGKVMTTSQLRQQLASANGADFACPLVTGIMLRIVAQAAEEERAQGKQRLAPWWRVVRDDGALNDKMPGGQSNHARLLQAEGHSITTIRGKPRLPMQYR